MQALQDGFDFAQFVGAVVVTEGIAGNFVATGLAHLQVQVVEIAIGQRGQYQVAGEAVFNVAERGG